MLQNKPLQPLAQPRAVLEAGLELGPSSVDEVIADVGPADVLGVPVVRGRGQLDRQLGHRALVSGAATGDVLDRVAVAIPRFGVGRAVSLGRIALQDGLDSAGVLEELVPVERADGAHAGDGVADGDLIRGLAQVLAAGELLGRHPESSALHRDPVHGHADRGVVIAQAAEELDEELRR